MLFQKRKLLLEFCFSVVTLISLNLIPTPNTHWLRWPLNHSKASCMEENERGFSSLFFKGCYQTPVSTCISIHFINGVYIILKYEGDFKYDNALKRISSKWASVKLWKHVETRPNLTSGEVFDFVFNSKITVWQYMVYELNLLLKMVGLLTAFLAAKFRIEYEIWLNTGIG